MAIQIWLQETLRSCIANQSAYNRELETQRCQRIIMYLNNYENTILFSQNFRQKFNCRKKFPKRFLSKSVAEMIENAMVGKTIGPIEKPIENG